MGLGKVLNDDFLLLFLQDVRNPGMMAGAALVSSKKNQAHQQLDSFISLQKGRF